MSTLRRLRWLGVVLLAANPVSAALVTIRAIRHEGFFTLPGAQTLYLSAVALLLLYAGAIVWLGRLLDRLPAVTGRRTVHLGLAAGVLSCAQLVTERFIAVPKAFNAPVVLAFMLLMFSLWGAAAFYARRRGRSVLASLGLSVVSAVITMSMAVCFGVVLELYVAPIAPESMRLWAEFQRTGWSDLRAFAIANTLDSVRSHLIAGPVVATIFGSLGLFVAKVTEKRLRAATKVG